MPILTCKRVLYYSHTDEAAFFFFIKSIKAVKHVEYVGDSVLLHVSSRISQQSLRDFISLFQRYRITGMSQLSVFVTDTNREWFTDPKMFWHRKVFSKSPH